MRTRVAGAWAAFIGVPLVILGGGLVLGCDTGQLLGQSCGADDECIEGAICRGALCVESIDLGRAPAEAGTGEDAATDAEIEADAAEDVAPDVTEDVVEDVTEDVTEDVANDAQDAADDAVDATDDAADAGDSGDA